MRKQPDSSHNQIAASTNGFEPLLDNEEATGLVRIHPKTFQRRCAVPAALNADHKNGLAGSNRVDPDHENMPVQVLKRRNKVGLAKKQAMPAVESRLLDVKAAAAYLSASIWFVRTLIWEKRVPYLKCGHKILFDRRDLDAFIDGNKIAVGR
jgi:excisionase family DNA binding protein